MATAKKKVSRKANPRKKADQTKMDQAVNIMEKMFFRQGKERKEIIPVLMKECKLSKAGTTARYLHASTQESARRAAQALECKKDRPMLQILGT